MAGEANRTRNHEEIRRWVEERGGHPATVARTEHGGDAGVLRIDFPGYSGEGSLQPISWDEFFDKFDENNLEFLYQDRTAAGEPSRFNKLVSAGSESGSRSRRTASSSRGTSTRRASSTRKSTASRKTTSRSKAGSRTTAKRATARRASAASRSTRKSTTGRSTTRKSTRSASAGSRRGTSATRKSPGTTRRRTRRTETEEPLIVAVVEAEPVPYDEVIRLEDEGPITGSGPSITETRPRNRERGTGTGRGTNPGQ